MENVEEKLDYQELFIKERHEWKEKIQVLALYLKNIRTVAEAQVDLFTQRQLLLEYSYKLASIVTKLNSKIRTENARLLKNYSEKNNIRYQANEKKVLIEGDISAVLEKADLVESHRKFIDQTIQTVDHMLYAIKNRIALEDYLRASTIK